MLNFSPFNFNFYNDDNNNGKDNKAPWLVIVYKIKIIISDKNIELVEVGGEGGGALLPNIIPK